MKLRKILQDPRARRNAAQRAAPQAVSDARGSKPTLREEAVEDIVRRADELVRLSPPSSLPTAWVQRAASTHADPAFIFVFDGTAGNINRCCDIFGIHGMPPVDLCLVCPVNMQDPAHLVCVISHVARLKPALQILLPYCWSWCKATDFAARDPTRMHTLI
jgi:hypothetical protein